MAIAPTALGGNSTIDNATDLAVTISRDLGALELAICHIALVRAAVDPAQPTVSGGGLTWVLVGVGSQYASGFHFACYTFRGMVATPSGTAITVGTGGITYANKHAHVTGLTGTDTTGTNGSGAIVQHTQPGTNSALDLITTAGATYLDGINNLALVAAFAETANARTWSPPSGMTEIYDAASAASTIDRTTMFVGYDLGVAGANPTFTVTHSGDTGGPKLGHMIEVAAPSAAGQPTLTRYMGGVGNRRPGVALGSSRQDRDGQIVARLDSPRGFHRRASGLYTTRKAA